MALPFFYIEEINTNSTRLELNEETSRHVVQVLRMKPGERLQVTDGKGNLFTTELVDDHKKKAAVKILSSGFVSLPGKKVAIGISLLKNTSRFEWFLEKATEIGVNEIIPLICARTEKQHFRLDRMKGILVSAMLQSQQSWLPVLQEPLPFSRLWQSGIQMYPHKWIAHCENEQNKSPLTKVTSAASSIILIGPEGDFTTTEIGEAIKNEFVPVTLGETRLRTETAGIAAAIILCNY